MKINREILRLSIPAIVSNITVPLLGLTDTAIAGHLDADLFIGAIAVGSMMLNVTFWLFGFLRMGTTGLTAQAYGGNDRRRLREIFSRSFSLGLCIGTVLLSLSVPLREMLLVAISPDPGVRTLASEYYTVCIFSAPAMLATTAIQGWLFGMQTTMLPMVISISVNIINIATSLILVFILKTGFIGIAYGTLTANWVGVFLALVIAKRKAHGRLWCGIGNIISGEDLKRFFSVNSDIFFRSGCIMAVSLTTTAVGARTGRFAGAGDLLMLKRSRNALLVWSASMAMFFFMAYALFSPYIVSLITDSPTVRENAGSYRLWLSLIPPLTVAAFIYDGFFIGLTATRRMLVATLLSASAFFMICFLHADGIHLPDNNGLWTSFLVYLLLRGMLLAFQSNKVFSQDYIKTLRSA